MTKSIRLIAPLALTALAAVLAAAPSLAQSDAAFTVVETGQRFGHLQDAVNAVGDSMGTIRIGPGRFTQCAVQERGDILYTAAQPGQTTFGGVACEGKAALVLRGRSARIEGLAFANIRVPDGNGAGIRLEHGNLAVAQTWFHDSQQGILTANDAAGTIAIDKSTFSRLGTCEGSGGCAHGLYVGDYGALTVTRTRFEAGRGGHYLKSRAAKIAVLNCSFDDSAGQTTNYMIDLSGGATGRIANNWFVQGKDKENYSAFIAVSAEGKAHSSDGLEIAGNDARFVPGLSRESVFVADWSGDALALGQNTLAPSLKRFEKR